MMAKRDYETCYECGCPVLAVFHPKTMKHHIACTVCSTHTLGYETEEEAQINWDRAWDDEWKSYSNKTIYTI